MKHFNDISNSVLIVIIILAIIEIIYVHNKKIHNGPIDILQINPDEPLTKKEMNFLLKHHIGKEKDLDAKNLCNKMVSAAVKGFAMGLLLDPNVHSMITYSFVSVSITAFLYGFEEFS